MKKYTIKRTKRILEDISLYSKEQLHELAVGKDVPAVLQRVASVLLDGEYDIAVQIINSVKENGLLQEK